MRSKNLSQDLPHHFCLSLAEQAKGVTLLYGLIEARGAARLVHVGAYPGTCSTFMGKPRPVH